MTRTLAPALSPAAPVAGHSHQLEHRRSAVTREIFPEASESLHEVGWSDMASARELAERSAIQAGLDAERASDVALAVHEATAHAVAACGGWASLRTWRTSRRVSFEVRCSFRDTPPHKWQDWEPGLWVARHLVDRFQTHAGPDGLRILLRINRPRPS